MPTSADIIDHSPYQPRPSHPVPTASNLILIDNYDSFTWNIYQYLVLEGATVHVFRNDQITLQELIRKSPSQLVISPGPGHPTTDSGISRDAIGYFAGKIPIFGVCMGLQCIFDVYGGDVNSAGEWLHGKTSPLTHDTKGVFQRLEQHIPVTRYHSLAGTYVTLPECLQITSWVANPDGSPGIIQGIRHNTFTVEGVQFHPESILTANGRRMIKNFLLMQGGTWDENASFQCSQPDIPHRDLHILQKAANQNILQTIYSHRKAAVVLQQQVPSQRLADLQVAYDLNAAPPIVSLAPRLRQSPFDVSLMAEIKRASPSKGDFALGIDAAKQARKYALAGASVISVLTEPEWFKGGIDDLRAVRQVLAGMINRPAILRKDFVFDEYQILEARLAGADTVLLIVKMLDEDTLTRLHKYSLSIGMEPLVEVQNSAEMDVAVRLGARVMGVNNRNLESFEVDLGTTGRLRSMVPPEMMICALSGINTHEDVLMSKKDGVDAVLVGEALMRAPQPDIFISELCFGRKPAPEIGLGFSKFVKICGMRTAAAAQRAAEAGADFVGIILAPQAKRCVSHEAAATISEIVHSFHRPVMEGLNRKISAAVAEDFFSPAAIASRLSVPGPRPRLVGVFKDQTLSEILEKQKLYKLDIVQLHGDEPLEWSRLIPVPTIRCFQPGQTGAGMRGYHSIPLLDSGAGSGLRLQEASIAQTLQKDPDIRCFLAGGLDPENIEETVRSLGSVSDRILGFDVSSGVEEDGQQSLTKIVAFIEAAKSIR